MRTTFSETVGAGQAGTRALAIGAGVLTRRAALASILLLGAALRFLNLGSLGFVNHYYAAAIEAMLQSWHNFFFVAAEPGGAVSVDKPPVGLWIQAISARIFGVNTFGLLLPEIVAGLISILIVYHLVRRSFGTVAGLVAALVLAVTPVVVATDRNNTIDSTLVLTLLLAAWAFIVAAERGSTRHLLLGAVLVGIGFNIKMMEAFLPLPAFYALYLFGSRQGLWRKVGSLSLASVVLVVVSFSWATIVDLTPADQRPYVGSSGDNSELSLAIGYNGVERLLGMGGRSGLLGGLFGGSARGGFGGGGAQPGGPSFGGQPPQGGFQRQGPGANRGGFPAGGPGGFQQTPSGGFTAASAAGMSEIGRAGALRLFTAPLAKEASWLLPFALFGMVLLGFGARPRWPAAPKHRSLLLWGGWLLTAGVFFSVAGFFHEYYLSVIGAPIAALAGIAVAEIWALRARRTWLAMAVLAAGAAATLYLQLSTVRAFEAIPWWLPASTVAAAAGVVIFAASLAGRRGDVATAGFALVIAAMLVAPGVWSALTALNPAVNQSLPAAYTGSPSTPPNGGGLEVNQALIDYLELNTQGTKYLLAVPSSMQGSDYVLATGLPVLYLGGFMGQDQVVTADDLSRMAAAGELKYLYWNSSGSRGGFGGGQSDVSAWVAANCTPVPGFETQTRNSGAPGGTSSGTTSAGGFGFGGSMQITLYEVRQATAQ